MQICNTVNLQHSDLVHDVAYDYYGQSLASCSSDHRIKVWARNTSAPPAKGEPDEPWVCTDDWTAHQGPVWKLQWAHPQYGRILASCSFDRTVAIWEELNHESSTSDTQQQTSRKSNWKLRTRRDSQEPVHDIAFAPRSLGLQLATVSGDGYVRIYKPDDASNLEYWHETSFDAVVLNTSGNSNSEERSQRQRAKELTSVAWCQAHFCPPMLAVAAKDGSIRIWAFNERYERWQIVHNLVGHEGAVHSIAWAPDTGRSYHLLASASSDTSVRIWGIAKSGDQAEAPDNGGGGGGGGGDGGGGGGGGGGANDETKKSGSSSSSASSEEQLKNSVIAPGASVQRAKFIQNNAHGSGKEVWRVQWDVSGMQLASSGDDGQVRLWRKKLQGLQFENFETLDSTFHPKEM
jgi:nucleoporin SEH1